MARKYLYFAALRLIKSNPEAKALWDVGRGERLDANKLFTMAQA